MASSGMLRRVGSCNNRLLFLLSVRGLLVTANAVPRRMVSSGMLRRVALVRTDVSEEPSASIKVTRIGELGTTLAATIN
jgi:hypothetical protein